MFYVDRGSTEIVPNDVDHVRALPSLLEKLPSLAFVCRRRNDSSSHVVTRRRFKEPGKTVIYPEDGVKFLSSVGAVRFGRSFRLHDVELSCKGVSRVKIG